MAKKPQPEKPAKRPSGKSGQQSTRKTSVGAAPRGDSKPRKAPYRPDAETAAADRFIARQRYLAGDRPEDIAADIGCTAKTVRNWVNEGGWAKELQDARKNPQQLDTEIAHLLKEPPSETRDRRIAMLTKARERMKRYTGDPKPRPKVAAAVHQELLNTVLLEEYGLYEYQKEFLLSDDRYRCILKARQIGFSYILGLACVLGAMAGRNQLIVSASQFQSDIVLAHAELHCNKLGIPFERKGNALLIGGAKVLAMPANFRTIQGWAGDIWLDEFAWHLKPDRIWHAILPSITQVGGRVTVCSTPFVPGNLFWKMAENINGKWSHFKRWRITIHDAIAQGMPLPGGIEELQLNFDMESWKMFYECHWAEDGSALLSWDLLQKLAVADIRAYKVGRIRAGVDVAFERDLFSVALAGQRLDPVTSAYCDEHILCHHEEHKGKTGPELRSIIKDVDARYAIQRWQIDRTGVGHDLAKDFALLWPERCMGRSFSPAYKERLALNLLKLAESSHLIIPNEPDVLAKLHAVKKVVSGQSVRYQAERDELGHGDLFWALALALDGAAKGGGGSGGMVKIL